MGPVSRSRDILFAILMSFLPGCASTPMPETHEDGKEHIDDTAAPDRLKAAIGDEPLLRLQWRRQ